MDTSEIDSDSDTGQEYFDIYFQASDDEYVPDSESEYDGSDGEQYEIEEVEVQVEGAESISNNGIEVEIEDTEISNDENEPIWTEYEGRHFSFDFTGTNCSFRLFCLCCWLICLRYPICCVCVRYVMNFFFFLSSR